MLQMLSRRAGARKLLLPAAIGAALALLLAAFYPMGASADGQYRGLSVTGSGTATASPDLAYVNLGVEAEENTASRARYAAAQAMAAVLESLRKNDLAANDIQTTYFSIRPVYDWVEETICPDTAADADAEGEADGAAGAESSMTAEGDANCRTVGRQLLRGYAARNNVRATVRDLDAVGRVLDDATEAGGNRIRIDGVTFGLEDASALRRQARELAVADLQATAAQLARLTGVRVGRLLDLAEYQPGDYDAFYGGLDYARAETALAAPTPIAGGELSVTVQVSGRYEIIYP